MTKQLAGLCFCLLMMAPSGMAQAQQGADGAAAAKPQYPVGFADSREDPKNTLNYAEVNAVQTDVADRLHLPSGRRMGLVLPVHGDG